MKLRKLLQNKQKWGYGMNEINDIETLTYHKASLLPTIIYQGNTYHKIAIVGCEDNRSLYFYCEAEQHMVEVGTVSTKVYYSVLLKENDSTYRFLSTVIQ